MARRIIPGHEDDTPSDCSWKRIALKNWRLGVRSSWCRLHQPIQSIRFDFSLPAKFLPIVVVIVFVGYLDGISACTQGQFFPALRNGAPLWASVPSTFLGEKLPFQPSCRDAAYHNGAGPNSGNQQIRKCRRARTNYL